MCHAANTKGTVALLAAILATAEMLGIKEVLMERWGRENWSFPEQVTERIQAKTLRAWRLVAEMEDVATTFRDVGLPAEFHMAAANIYQKLAHFKDCSTTPTLSKIVEALSEVRVSKKCPDL